MEDHVQSEKKKTELLLSYLLKGLRLSIISTSTIDKHIHTKRKEKKKLKMNLKKKSSTTFAYFSFLKDDFGVCVIELFCHCIASVTACLFVFFFFLVCTLLY